MREMTKAVDVRKQEHRAFFPVVRVGCAVAARAGEEGRRHAQTSSRWRAPVRDAPDHHGVAEGLNSKIMSIKRKASGFRNASNYTTAIYFHCGVSIYTHADPGRGYLSDIS